MFKPYLFGFALAAVLFHGSARAGFDVQVDIENVSGEKKTDWPVVLRAYEVLGRNLPTESIHLKNLRVIDPSGREVPFGIEEIPPYDEPGNDEIVFLVPSIGPSEKQSWRVSLVTTASSRCAPVDVVNSPHNLLKNGGFEKEGKPAEGWSGDGARDTTVKHSGAASLLLKGVKEMTARLDAKIPLHKDSWYYFGGWGKTENVSRGALGKPKSGCFELPGFSNHLVADIGPGGKKSDAEKRKELEKRKQADIIRQCGTRDWAKTQFWIKGRTDWGMETYRVQATADTTTFTATLDQEKQFFMEKGKEEGRWWVDDLVLLEQPRVTVRFDLALAAGVKDGVFLFTRPSSASTGCTLTPDKSMWIEVSAYCSFPFPQEAVTDLSCHALKGQRVPFILGLYHEKPLAKLEVRVKNAALIGPGGARIALEEIEWMPGSLGEGRSRMLRTHTGPLELPNPKGIPYFVASFVVPGDAKPGLYRGNLDVTIGGGLYRSVPLSLTVEDLSLPVVRDVYLGSIFQGNGAKSDQILCSYGDGEEVLRQCGRSGFTCITMFRDFLAYNGGNKPDAEGYFINLEKVRARMDQLVKYGITGGVCPFLDLDLGPLWGGGKLYKCVKGDKSRWQAEIKRLDAECKKHPEWPRIIYMTWDEPTSGGWELGKHGGPDERMGWVLEVLPDALTNADIHLGALDKTLKYYNMPTFDDPCDFVGPEIFNYVKKMGKDYGMAGTRTEPGEACRYQYGIMMASMGARYLHRWHLSVPINPLLESADGKVLRSIEMVAAGEGVVDFKVYRLLKDEIAKARAGNNPAKKALADKAEQYLAEVFKTWSADHDNIVVHPYLGYAYAWGHERFYDEWRLRMLRFAVDLAGVTWVE